MADAPRSVLAVDPDETLAIRPDRQEIVAFVRDVATEAALRDALAEVMPQGMDVRRGNVRAAIMVLRRMTSPRTLIVDISGEEDPLAAIEQLRDVVEPDIRVLLIGDRQDADFYRQVTRGQGVLEYIYKPLQRDMIARYFGPLLASGKGLPHAGYGGSVVAVTGVRGGVGASTIAANLAWHFGVEANRQTVILDGDLHRGTCAMLLGAVAGPGLRTALETPACIDDNFVERVAQLAAARLHVLAGEEDLGEQPVCVPGASARLLDALRRRYNFVVVDLPFTGMQMHRDLMMLAHHRILVMDPTLASVRDTLRLLALPNAPMQPRRAMVVVNRLGRPGTLTLRQIEDAMKVKIDVVLPDLPKVVGAAAKVGDLATVRCGFRVGIVRLAREVAMLRDSDDSTDTTQIRAKRKPGFSMGRLLGRPQSA